MIGRQPPAIDIDAVMQSIRAELEMPAPDAGGPSTATISGDDRSEPAANVAVMSPEPFSRSAFRRLAGLRLIGFPIRVVHGIVRLPRILRMVVTAQAHIANLERSTSREFARIDSHLGDMRAELSSRDQDRKLIAANLLREQQSAARNAISRLEDRLRDDRQVAQDAIARLEDRLGAVAGDVTDSSGRIAPLSRALDQLQTRLGDLWGHIVDQQRRLDILLTEARRRLPEKLDEQQLQLFAREQDRQLHAWYAGFEDRYRGTRRDIKERQRVYLPAIRKAADAVGDKPFLDIGCGRGEFLELLKEGGFAASGIDVNPIMVAKCRELGLEASEAEALSWLRSLPADSLAGVTGFHIIEHVPFAVLIALFDECLRVLAPGGLVAFETPNPANLLVAAERFYIDPTHCNPLPSSTVSFVAEARGFTQVDILPLHPVPAVERRVYDDPLLTLLQEKLYGPQDYGLLAWKAK